MIVASQDDQLDELLRGPFGGKRRPEHVIDVRGRVQLVAEPQEKALARAEHRALRVLRAQVADLVLGQADARPAASR